MKKLIIARMEDMKKQNGFYFNDRTYFDEKLTEIDLQSLSDEKLISLFEFMTKLHYTQR